MTKSQRQADTLPPFVTDEMVRLGCAELDDMGGAPKNPHFPPSQFKAAVRQILEVALGLRPPDAGTE